MTGHVPGPLQRRRHINNVGARALGVGHRRHINNVNAWALGVRRRALGIKRPGPGVRRRYAINQQE